MLNDKPAVFIGSSSERLDEAREVEQHLQKDAVPTIWTDGVFGLGTSILEALMNALEQFDFAIIILGGDDMIESRGMNFASPRDNTIFELGLFMGRLGRSRTFVIHESDVTLKLPSDLAGITVSSFQKRDNLAAALSPACWPIIKAIRSLGFLEQRTHQQIRAVAREQKEQQSIIERHQEFFDIVKYSVSYFCYVTLWHLANGPEYLFKKDDADMRRRLYFLTDSGYIEPRDPDGFLVFDERLHDRDLCQVAKLTPIGKYLVDLRGNP